MPVIPIWALKIGAVALLAVAIIAFGRSRYNDGVSDTDAKWEEAGDRLAEQAKAASGKADAASAKHAAAEFERVKGEKEKLDAANDAGSSPLDVLFGD